MRGLRQSGAPASRGASTQLATARQRCGSTMPRSSSNARIWLINAVRSATSRSRPRCSACTSSCASAFSGTKRIVGRVEEIDSLVGEIAASAQEQATGLAEVNGAVNQMDQVTQQNAAMVEESTAASHALAGEAEVLAGSVARFKIGQPQRVAAAPRAAPALKRSARDGSALRKPQPQADGWEEF